MANLQYIGARYVPKFYENPDDQSNDWKAGEVYEPLTIVTFNNDSYTSKKPVLDTVGDPANNPEYWALTGQYNASIIAINNTIAALEAEIDNRINLFYTPDMFGSDIDTDAAKLQLAFDALESTGGCILIDRTLNLDADISIKHHGNGSDENTPIFIIGGKEGVINMDGCIFKGSALRRGGCKFLNVTFVGADNTSDYCLAGDDTLRRMWFLNCKFDNFRQLMNSDASQVNANVWSFDGCTFINFGNYVFQPKNSAIIVRFLNCVFQDVYGGIDFSAVTGQASNVVIDNCTLTLCTASAIKIGNNNQNIQISGCDFEANDISINASGWTQANTWEVVISDCYFSIDVNTDTACIILPGSHATNSYIEKERIIPFKVTGCRFPVTNKDIIFAPAPGQYHKIYADIEYAAPDVEDYLHLYRWKKREYAVTYASSDPAGTLKSIVTFAQFLTDTGRADIKEYFISPKNGTGTVAWMNTSDNTFKASLVVVPGASTACNYEIFYRN